MTKPARHDVSTSHSWDATAVAELEAICTAEQCTTRRGEALGRHTSMGVGGPTPESKK